MLLDEGWSTLDYKLNPQLIKALTAFNFTKMMPVQKAAIPLMMKNYDLAVEAQTGSGKSLAFVIPIIEHLIKLSPSQDKIHTPIFLILSPTRQLCQQTYTLLIGLLEKMQSPLLKQVVCCTGGHNIQQDIARCKQSVLVMVATVGRCRQVIQNTERYMKNVDFLYIDEGDRVLKEKGIAQVVSVLPKMRRTAIFSATLQGITQNDLKLYGMRNLAKISLKTTNIQPQKPRKKEIASVAAQADKHYSIPQSLINQYFVAKDRADKLFYLIAYLRQHCLSSKSIIFLSTCACVEYYSKLWSAMEDLSQFKIVGLHGRLKAKKRNRIITDFMSKKEEGRILVATDVISRGIDFGDVEYIFQLDPPDDPDNFVHRIGRTARVNREGYAMLFLQPHQIGFISYLQNKNVPINEHIRQDLPYDHEVSRQCIMNLILSDRDYIQRAKQAFVSFIRSYKQHELKFIFEFKKLPLGPVADSFFLLRIPRIKEILGKKIDNFVQSDIDPETVPWQDSNQKSQYDQRKHKRQAEKQATVRKPTIDIKNKRSLRKKLKRRIKEQEQDMFRKEQKQIMKERFVNRKKPTEQDLDDLSMDTEQLQQKIQGNRN